ncbi:hypothetical protein IW150_006206 [Coemansia sp. RSA 2607]|nr:hypothetical protein IW150_006206 [Coemansia sp. RSA 2607]
MDYDSAPQNEDEANAMSEAELRQFAVSFARQKNISSSSLPLLDHHSDIRPHSPPSPYTHSSSHVSSVRTSVTAHTNTEPEEVYKRDAMGYLQDRKRHRNDTDSSASQQRMGIDLLLNASTLSDKMDCYKSPEPQESYQLMSPPTHSISPPVLPSIAQLAQGYTAAATAAASEPYSRMSLSPPLPPIGAHPMSAPTESAFEVGSGGACSLEAYRIGGNSGSKMSRSSTGYSHANSLSHSFPPPVSDIRNLSSTTTTYGQHPTPPDSNYSSPTGVTPSQGPQCASSRGGILSVPSSASMALPPTGDVVVCPDLHHRSSYPVSPTSPPVYRTEPRQQQQLPPQHVHQPVSPEFTFSHPPPPPPPQSSQISRNIHFHNIYTPTQSYYVGQPPSTHQQPPITIQQQHMTTAPVVVRNVSKPKFNYAFLDTKRPRGPSARWSAEEDALLKRAVRQYGEDRQWVKVSQQVPGRTNLQCRQRWLCNIKAQVEKERQQQLQQQQNASH